ncbi:MAG TPA: hypothetical protein VJ776_10620, partial [Thermoanaerobaculia bacterium]|nr:hypothetical protein [Thermoanaerobaculia bacterium]
MGPFSLIPRRLGALVILVVSALLATQAAEARARTRRSRSSTARAVAAAPQPKSLAEALAQAAERPPTRANNLSIE